MDLSTMSREELLANSKQLDEEILALRKQLKSVNDEIAFRDNEPQRRKALQQLAGLSKDDLARLLQPSSVASEEKVHGVG
jgi:hypothetical protein